MTKPELYCGWEVSSIRDLEDHIDKILDLDFQYTLVDVCTGRQEVVNKFINNGEKVNLPGLNSEEAQLFSTQNNQLTGAVISPWLQLDIENQFKADVHEQQLRFELMFSQHLGLPVVVLPQMSKENNINYARIVKSFLSGHTSAQYWLRIPVHSNAVQTPWQSWDSFRTLCDQPLKIFPALELTKDLPALTELKVWAGEVVKGLFIPCDLFLFNNKGFPVLSKKHQEVVRFFMKFPTTRFTLSGTPIHPDGIKPYLSYLKYMHYNLPNPDPLDDFSLGYEDYLQAPLQPLMDHLESGTYEVFEMDPIKYQEYENAVYKALLDRTEPLTTIYVVGAGRGPLVARCLKAAENARKKVKLFALEKNPNAIVTLQKRKKLEWGDKVEIISGDMRFEKPSEKADILVSELLGSFGDNELSPECLDGAQSFLKEGGISIPKNYTSFIAPLMAPKLYNDLESLPTASKCATNLTNYETPYVVRMKNHFALAPVQPLFVFEHPNFETPIDNNRYDKKSFVIQENGRVHGIAGYFESVLYDDVIISINPETHSPDMLSWFPIYFPIQDPFNVKKGDKVTIHFWRKVDAHKVWYEWCISSPVTSAIHNTNARSYFIGL